MVSEEHRRLTDGSGIVAPAAQDAAGVARQWAPFSMAGRSQMSIWASTAAEVPRMTHRASNA